MILAIIRDPGTGLKIRRLYDQNIGLNEIFIEAVPTTLILTYIIAFTRNSDSDNLDNIIFGETDLKVGLFILTYSLSIFSACLGLAKCLKNGVARPIAPGGPVDGLLSGRFILVFIASA